MGRKPIIRSADEKQKMKVETRKRHQLDLRRAAFIADYMLLTAPQLHSEATAFLDQLQAKYPGKRDVRKTDEFRLWQMKQLGLTGNDSSHGTDQTTAMNSEKETVLQTPEDYTNGERETALQPPEDKSNRQKEMVLQIPLMHVSTGTKETLPVLEKETLPVLETIPVLDVQEDQLINIFDDIPNDVMNDLIAEIRADPDLCAIMDKFSVDEEVQDQIPEDLCPEWDIGLNIEIGDPLEDEINSMLF